MEPTDSNTTAPQQFTYNSGPSQRKIVLSVLAVIVLIGGLITGILLTRSAAVDQESESSVETAQVIITADSMTPAAIQIKKGQSVVWINEDQEPHVLDTSVQDQAAGASGFGTTERLNAGETYSYVFNQAGTYAYADAINPQRFQGVIIVK